MPKPAGAIGDGMYQDRLIESYYPDGSLVTAGPGRRLAGALLDGLVLSFTLGIGWLIWFIIIAPKGQTPGKQMAGMYVMRADGSRAGGGILWVREVILKLVVMTLISWATFGIFPLIAAAWCLWDKNAQCLWDKMGGTYVAWSPRGYTPLTDQELKRTGQSLEMRQSEPRTQAYRPDTVLRAPEGSPFASGTSPFASGPAPVSPFGGGPGSAAPDATTHPSAPPTTPAVEAHEVPAYPPAASGAPGASAAGQAHEVTSPFASTHATSPGTSPAAPQPISEPPALPSSRMLPQHEESPFALPGDAVPNPGETGPGALTMPPSPFAQPAEWPDFHGGPGASPEAAPSPFDFSDDPTFVPESTFGPAGDAHEPEPGSQFEPPPAPPVETLPTAADRLRELARLRAEDLLTEAEYQSRRQALLDQL